MNHLELALDLATRMREHVQSELESAREQRVLVRKLDVQGLFERAQARGEFNVVLAQLQGELNAALKEVGAANGEGGISLATLRASSEPAAHDLAGALNELRASAQALQEIDSLNQILARRALACVRGYISALSPRADAYDRYGGARVGGSQSITRQVA
jgi:hypothetical protein